MTSQYPHGELEPIMIWSSALLYPAFTTRAPDWGSPGPQVIHMTQSLIEHERTGRRGETNITCGLAEQTRDKLRGHTVGLLVRPGYEDWNTLCASNRAPRANMQTRAGDPQRGCMPSPLIFRRPHHQRLGLAPTGSPPLWKIWAYSLLHVYPGPDRGFHLRHGSRTEV